MDLFKKDHWCGLSPSYSPFQTVFLEVYCLNTPSFHLLQSCTSFILGVGFDLLIQALFSHHVTFKRKLRLQYSHNLNKQCTTYIWAEMFFRSLRHILIIPWEGEKIKIDLRIYQVVSETVHANSDSFSRAATAPPLFWEWLIEDQTWLRRINHSTVVMQKATSHFFFTVH